MLKKELLKLTPKERDVIYLWRITSYPKILTVEEIRKSCSGHSIRFIRKTIHKFNNNCRLKLELYSHQKDLDIAFGLYYFDKKRGKL